jgi:hypothetical protein
MLGSRRADPQEHHLTGRNYLAFDTSLNYEETPPDATSILH